MYARHEVQDAVNKHLFSTWNIQPDAHGVVIEIEDCNQSIVVDFARGVVNIYISDDEGEVVTEPVGAIKLLKHVPEGQS